MTDNTTEIVRRKGATVRVKFGEGYDADVVGKTMVKLKNTGNGYVAKFPSFSRCNQDNWVCLDYSEAHVLWLALNEFFTEDTP